MAQAPKPTTEASIPDFPNVRYFIVLLIHPQPESGTAIYPPLTVASYLFHHSIPPTTMK
jgi:hypothetical protein